MRILNLYFLSILCTTLSCLPLFGNTPDKEAAENNNLSIILRDTTCGLLDTVYQTSRVSCPGVADGSARIDIEGASGPLVIRWDNGSRGSAADGLTGGIHYVSVTDFSGCVLIDSVFIEEPPPLSYSFSFSDALCTGVNTGLASVTDSLGYSYQWSTGDNSNEIANLEPGEYSLTISDGNCFAVENFTIGTVETATLQAELSNATCIGIDNGAISINDTLDLPGYSYLWNTGDSTNQLNNLSPLLSYSVTVTSDQGCTAIDSFSLEVNQQLEIAISLTNATCNGISDGSITINDGLDTENLRFAWSTGDSTSSLSNLEAGTYGVAVADTAGCLAAASIEIVNELTFSVSTQIIDLSCEVASNGAITIIDSMTTPDFQYSWSTGDSTDAINNLDAGLYVLTVTDTQGCITVDSLMVGITPTLSITGNITNATCLGVNDGIITIDNGDSSGNHTYLWSTGDSSQILSGLAPGAYALTLTDPLGCMATDSFLVGADQNKFYDNSIVNPSCSELNDGSISLTDSLLGDLLIRWSTGDSAQMINNLGSGSYSVEITDTMGCITNQTFQLEAGPGPEIAISKTDESCTGIMDGTITINEGMENTSLSFDWNTGDSMNVLTGLSAGIYSVTVTDSLGCRNEETIEITALTTFEIDLSAMNVSCSGLSDGAVQLESEHSALTILWNTGDDTPLLSNLSMGIYTITVTDTAGCSVTDSIRVEADSSLLLSLTGGDITCFGGTNGFINATLVEQSSNEGLSYRWNTGDTTNSVRNLTMGTYSVTITDDTGCMGNGSVSLSEGDSIAIGFVASGISCMDTLGSGAILAVPSGGAGSFTFDWNTGDTSNSLIDLLAGTYTVTVTDSLGCIQTDSYILQNPPDVVLNTIVDRNASCIGARDGQATVTVTEGTAPFQIRWSNGSTNSVLENLDPGIYTVNVTDEAGCEAIDTITVIQTTVFNLSFNEIRSASNAEAADAIASVAVSGGLAPYSFEWDNGERSDTARSLTPGFHTVTITDQNGCTFTDSFNIRFYSLFVNIIEVSNLICGGAENGRATAAPATGIAPFRYIWSRGDTTPIVNNFSGGTYTVTVTDAEGSIGTATVTLTEPEPIRFNLEITAPGCPDLPNGRIVINPTGTVGNPLYDFGFGLTSDPVILGISDGTKRYRIIDANNCRADTTFVIEALSPNLPEPVFSFQSLGPQVNFTENTANTPLEFLWKFGDGTTSALANPTHEYPDTGNYEVCMIVSNNCGTDSLCQDIRIDPIPIPGVELSFGVDTSSLSGQIIHIPVMVNAFEEVAGISGTFELSNPAVGEIQGVSSINLEGLSIQDFTITDNYVSLEWTVVDTSQLLSLNSGTQIFVIDLLLTGASDECSRIIPTNTASELEFTKTFMGSLVAAPFLINSGEFCVAPTVSLAGNVSREEEIPISGVTVTTNGELPFITKSDGNFQVTSLPGGADFTLAATKEDEILAGVSTFDIVRILQHILTRSPLESPYKIIAADIDNSATVTSIDLIHLQRLILQQTTVFPNNAPWRFVPESYAFPNPENPFVPEFPETIVLPKLELDQVNLDFIAVKTGDVINESAASNARLPGTMGLFTEEQIFEAGELVKIPFHVANYNEFLGFQLELGFQSDLLKFKGLANTGNLKLTEQNLGLKQVDNGKVKILWVNQDQIAIRGGALFELEFEARKKGKLTETLQLMNERFLPQIFTEQGKKIRHQKIELAFNTLRLDKGKETTLHPETMMNFNTTTGTPENCNDGMDNDNDQLIDCADADCFCECNTTPDSDNLILNPDAELSLNSGEWQLVQGSWSTRGANPDPQNGAAYFYPLNSDTAQLTQVIDLNADSALIEQGLVQYVFNGYVRSFDQVPSDETQIILEYRNEQDSAIGSYNSGFLASLADWQLLTDTFMAPPGTHSAIVNLIAHKNNGNNNDAYFDNLSLIRQVNETCEDPCADLSLLFVSDFAIPNGQKGSATATLSGGTGPVSYNWNTGDITDQIEASGGVYTVGASDSLGCTLIDSVEIVNDSTFFIAFNPTFPTCHGDANGAISAMVIGGTAPYTLTWSDTLLSGDSLSNLPSGVYSLTATDSTGLSTTGTITLEPGVFISLNRDSSKISPAGCPGDANGRLSMVAQGGMAPYTFILNNDTTNNGVYLDLTAQIYPVEIIDATGCSTMDSVEIVNSLSGITGAEFTVDLTDSTLILRPLIVDSTATYSWTLGDGNSTAEIIPEITYAEPGTYQVCLTTTNTCGMETSCETVSFGISGPVTFIINELNGIANDTVYVPVAVENFVNILSFQKTIAIEDTSIARFIGITDFNLSGLTESNFYLSDDHTITNVWYDATAVGQDLPNQTVIYNLMVMINSEVDTCVSIQFSKTPVPAQVSGFILEDVAEVEYRLIDGEVCTRESAMISGNITRETGVPVAGVQLTVTDFANTSSTNADGQYLIEKLNIGGNYEITPSLNTPLLESVSTFDIVLINRHILGNRLLDSPYKLIAADVNRNGSITTFDLVLIQRAILGLNTDFPGNTAWRFIPKSYEFPDPTNPFAAEFPESISIDNLTGNLIDQDFIGVKIAEVSYTIEDSEGEAAPRSNETLVFEAMEQKINRGEEIQIPFSVPDIEKFDGFQIELDFDPQRLSFTGLGAGTLPGFNKNNVGVKYLNRGKIQILWVSPNDQVLNDAPIFYLNFDSKVKGNISEEIRLSHYMIPSESYTKDLQIGHTELVFTEGNEQSTSKVILYPNPSTGIVELLIPAARAEKVRVSLYNFTGQLVRELNNIDQQKIRLDLSELNEGAYLLIVQGKKVIDRKKVILKK